MKNTFTSIFGDTPETQQARETRDLTFQSMLDARRRSAEQQRTDDVKMARYNALGNLLTTMVQPVGWAIGGGGVGNTGGVQKYDDRQYITAFNRAVKAADDIRNIGLAEEEYKLKMAENDYARALRLEDEERLRRQRQEDFDRQMQARQAAQEAQDKASREALERRYELQKQLAETQAAGRIEVEKAKAANRAGSSSKSSKKTKSKDDKKDSQRSISGKIRFNTGGRSGDDGSTKRKKDVTLER